MEGKSEVHFLKVSEKSLCLERAFKLCQKAKLKPKWTTEQACMSVTNSVDRPVFVFDVFRGAAYENLLKLGCRIYGAPAVLSCLQAYEILPKLKEPVFCNGLKGVVVCCTGLKKVVRAEVHSRVQMMNGRISRDFTEAVTHLIANAVGSDKYQVAAQLEKTIVTPSWVLRIWDAYVTCADADELIPAAPLTDPQFDQYNLPVFKDLTVTVSGISDRAEIKRIVEQGGGKYSGQMKMGECSHLLTNVPKGDKFSFATKWGMKVVRDQWLHDCVSHGYHLPEKLYSLDLPPPDPSSFRQSVQPTASKGDSVKKQAAASTPNLERGKSVKLPPDFADISAIPDVSVLGGKRKSVGLAGCAVGSVSRVGETCLEGETEQDVDKESMDVIMNMPVIGNRFFMDTCKIYIHGFSGNQREKVKQLVGSSGASRAGAFSAGPSHALITRSSIDHIKEQMDKLEPNQSKPKVVGVSWLVECLKKKTAVSVQGFELIEDDHSGLSTKEDATIQEKAEDVSSDLSSVIVLKKRAPPIVESIGDIIAQYSNSGFPASFAADSEQSGAENSRAEQPATTTLSTAMANAIGQSSSANNSTISAKDPVGNLSKNLEGGSANTSKLVDTSTNVSKTDLVTGSESSSSAGGGMPGPVNMGPPSCKAPSSEQAGLSLSEKENGNKGFLAGLTVSVVEFMDKDREVLGELIKEHGGLLVDSDKPAKLDYAVHPVFGTPKLLPSGQSVTNTWLSRCVEENRLIDIVESSLFTPTNIQEGVKPLKDCIICVSGFTGAMRETVRNICEMSGATFQESMARKAFRNFKVTTHLVVSEASGKKFEAAVKWNLPTVTVEWLLESMRVGKKQPEKNFDPTVIDQSVVKPSTSESTQARGEGIPDLNKLSTKLRTHQLIAEATGTRPHIPSPVTPVGSGSKTNSDSANQSTSANKSAAGTPQFLNSDKSFHANFDLDDFKSALRTPVAVALKTGRSAASASLGSSKKNTSLPLGGLLEKHMAEAVANLDDSGITSPPPNQAPVLRNNTSATRSHHSAEPSQSSGAASQTSAKSRTSATPRQSPAPLPTPFPSPLSSSATARKTGPVESAPAGVCVTGQHGGDAGVVCENLKVLEGCVVSFSRKLSSGEQEKMGRVVMSLGGSCSRTLVDSITHFVFKGRSSEKEYKTAKKLGKIVVSPHWISACEEASRKVDESFYPHSYNPDRSLAFVNLSMSQSQASQQPPPPAASTTKKMKKGPGGDHLSQESSSLRGDVADFLTRFKPAVLNTSAQVTSSGESARKVVIERGIDGQSSLPKDTQGLEGGASQHRGAQIVWEDATSRGEKANLAEDLERATTPTQQSQQKNTGETAEGSCSKSFSQMDIPTMPGSFDSTLGDCLPDEVTAAAAARESSERPLPVNRVFLLSGLNSTEKETLIHIIWDLGAVPKEDVEFDDHCTHLITDRICRNGKCLSCIAGGKWVLTKEYLLDSRAQGRFVEESPYEWGGPGTVEEVKKSTPASSALAEAALKWRQRLCPQIFDGRSHAERMKASIGAFSGWKVILLVTYGKEESCKTILQAGAGVVVATARPFPEDMSVITHAFLTPARIQGQFDMVSDLVAAGVTCLKPEYIAAYLKDVGTTPLDGYLYPVDKEEQKLSGSKRQRTHSPAASGGSEDGGHNKRSKRSNR